MDIEDRVASEISSLHKDLAHWLSGRVACDPKFFRTAFRNRFHVAFYNVQPAGLVLSRTDLLHGLDSGYGASPNFDICIRNVRVRQVVSADEFILATYEEYQRGARNSDRPMNARLSTVLFEQQDSALIWHAIHETWLPDENHDPAYFVF